MTTDKDDARTRDALVNSGACPGLADILLDYLEAHDALVQESRAKDAAVAARDASESPQPVAPEEPDPIDAAIDAELAARKARDALRPVAIDALQVVINVSRSKANRPVIAKAGCVPPACALLDPAVHPAEITSRACMVLINCCTGEDAEATRVAAVAASPGRWRTSWRRRSKPDPETRRRIAPRTSSRSSRTNPRRARRSARRRELRRARGAPRGGRPRGSRARGVFGGAHVRETRGDDGE